MITVKTVRGKKKENYCLIFGIANVGTMKTFAYAYFLKDSVFSNIRAFSKFGNHAALSI